MRVIDLFAGAGGFSTGFKKAGFDIVVANEIDKQIAVTYKKNHPDTVMITADIKDFVKSIDEYINIAARENNNIDIEIFQNKLKNIDIIIGGPPCQGFSMAGARIRQEGAFLNDPRNFLFKYYFKVIQHFEPTYFVMENVQGLTTINGGAILKEIISLFENKKNFKNGRYYLNYKVLNSAEFGVPQARKRLVIIGSKYNTVEIDPSIVRKENENKYKTTTLHDAISDLAYLESSQGKFEQEYKNSPQSQYQRDRRKNSNKLYNHMATKHNKVAIERIKKIKVGENFQFLDEDIKSVHSGAYGRLNWDDVCTTITTRFDTPSAGRVIHPVLNRALTPREAARIQSFDDDFIFYGNRTSVGKQIGNAVPPIMAEALAKIIIEDMKKNGYL
jgi:DNA (cytosine-5)-methyltransferase 1